MLVGQWGDEGTGDGLSKVSPSRNCCWEFGHVRPIKPVGLCANGCLRISYVGRILSDFFISQHSKYNYP